MEYQIYMCGKVKVVVLEVDSACPDIVASGIYNTKPVHSLSIVCEGLKW